jgi:heme/copper-type cytochrome/quinol oxidase subunit 3
MNDKARLGMILFIASESVFFALLIIAFVVYHSIAGNAAEVARNLNVFKTGIFTLFLLSSSFTVRRGGISQRHGRHAAALGWLGATVLLGAVFLGGQALEYGRLIGRNVTISRDLFGTTFFTLTGFHALHVLTGLIMLSILVGMGLRWMPGQPRKHATEAVSLYWHFVDVVWMVIFPIVYLWGAL